MSQRSNQTASSASAQPPMAAAILVQHIDRLNYASWQNSVPLITSLEIANLGAETLSGLVLECDAQPAFARHHQWQIDRIAPGSTLAVNNRHLELDPNYLEGLNESERAIIRFRLLRGPAVIAESSAELRVLAAGMGRISCYG